MTKATAEGFLSFWDLTIFDAIGFTNPTQIPHTKFVLQFTYI